MSSTATAAQRSQTPHQSAEATRSNRPELSVIRGGRDEKGATEYFMREILPQLGPLSPARLDIMLDYYVDVCTGRKPFSPRYVERLMINGL